MKSIINTLALTSILFLGQGFAQNDPTLGERASEVAEETREKAAELTTAAKDKAAQLTDAAKERADEISNQLQEKTREFQESEEANQASASVVEWVQSAESLYRPWMNWALVAVGIGLFISHAGQLLIGKLWCLVRGKGCNVVEVVNDFLVMAFTGLALPAVLLIPVGHGAFISNPLAVLSAAAVGMILGVVLYTHGMRQELLAGQENIDRKEEDSLAEG